MTQSFIERQFPVSKVSKESYKERKSSQGQTITGLGKWWGRKPLTLVRTAILGCLLPATDNPEKDMETFLKEQRMGIKYAEHAIKDQGADFVLIEFSALDSKIPARIKEMVRIGIHGYFYCDDEKGFHSF